MRSRLRLGAALAIVLALALGSCVPCPDTLAIESGTYVPLRADDEPSREVQIDLDTKEVLVSYERDGHQVVEVWSIVELETAYR